MPKRFKKLVIMIAAAVLLFAFVIPEAAAIVVYNTIFNDRYEPYAPLMFRMEDFPGLERTRYSFPSDRGQTLVGYLFRRGAEKPKGVVVICHGLGGGGQIDYLDCANCFAENGYWVFAYDGTGNGESEGEDVRGLPQAVIDLDYAISFVKETFAGLPVMLFGHSWGGYAAASVLQYHPDVKAVASVAGMNCSADLMRVYGKEAAGFFADISMPYVDLYERLKFGKYASAAALDGFEASDAAVLIVHSEDDTRVPISIGYELYYEQYADSERFRFIRYTDRGHGYVYDSQHAVDYLDDFYAGLEACEENEKNAYVAQNLDRTLWTNRLDTALFSEIISLYDSALESVPNQDKSA